MKNENNLGIVIVEDEPISSEYLKKLIRDTGVDHHIVQNLDSVSDAMAFFAQKVDFDLIFMDIHLGDGTCFDILNAVDVDKPIIFCTTFDMYAVQAFKYNSIDYILKPAKPVDIEKAIQKYRSLQKVEEEDYLLRIDKMMTSFIGTNYKKRFLVRKNHKLTLIHIDQVVGFYSEEGQTYLIEESENEHHVDFTLERLEEMLDPGQFFRINRKMIISINFLKSIEDYFNNRLKIKLTHKSSNDLIVSRNRVKEFKNWLKGVS
ncbi:LytTR family DNA-binding domain-containing protein [Flagellimonas sp. DF-77]|uniref:LytR/AlgR family response regulator transcription factor n=1 Tax=Flagellimonas algarum TaxID=3230298 RepID=UPI0033986EB2